MPVFAPPVAVDFLDLPESTTVARVNVERVSSLLLDFLRGKVEVLNNRRVGRGYTVRQIAHWFGDSVDVDRVFLTSATGTAIPYLTDIGLIETVGRHVFLGGIAWIPAPGDDMQPIVEFAEPPPPAKKRKKAIRLLPCATGKRRLSRSINYGPPGCLGSGDSDYMAHYDHCRNRGFIPWDEFVKDRHPRGRKPKSHK